MKHLKFLLGLILLVAVFAVYSQPTIDVQCAVNYAHDHIGNIDIAKLSIATIPLISTNITPEIIQDMKVKFGSIKIITVVVEPSIYDIDNIPFADLIKFKQLGIDAAILTNTYLDISDRIKELEKLIVFKDGNKWDIASELFSKYSGKELEKGEKYQFLARRPDKGLIKMLSVLGREEKYEEFNDKAIKNLIVGGDLEVLENDGLVYMGVVEQLKPLMKHASSFLSRA